MAIEFITPDHVMIKGHVVELRDTRVPDVFDAMSEADNRALQEMYGGPIQDHEIDLSRFPTLALHEEAAVYQQIPRFIDLARRAAQERAVSYRDFKVGASAYAIASSPPSVGYLFGANLTPHEGAPKRCAEMDVIAKAHQRGFDFIAAIATFGPPDLGEVNRLVTPTLHPCAPCRALLAANPLVQDETLLITGNEQGDREVMFVRDLLELHGPE